MTDTLIATLRNPSRFTSIDMLLEDAADRIEALQAEVEWITKANIDHVAARVSYHDQIERMQAERELTGKVLKKCMDELQEMIVCRNAAGDAVFDLKAENARIGIDAAKEIVKLRTHITALEKQEPVAWKYQEATHPEGDLRGRGWRFHQFSMSKPNRPWMQDDVIPLYLAAGAAPQQVEPKEQP